MAHELEFDAAGKGKMFSVLETPWHREGHVLTQAPSFDEAIRLAGHDYTVEVRPTYRKITVGTATNPVSGEKMPIEDYIENEQAKITVRTDSMSELGSVGRSYTPLQNRDAFGVLVPLLDQGLATLETGGTLRGGADAWMMVRFNLERFGEQAREVLGDELLPFGLIANNHNGRRGVLLQITPVRVVCANTLGMTEQRAGLGDQAEGESANAILVRHTAEVEAKVVEAAEKLFAGIVARYEVVAKQYKRLKAYHLDTALFRQLVVGTVAPNPSEQKGWNPEARMAESVMARWEKKRDALETLWTAGKGHTGDHSAWEAYNAVVEAIDHDRDGLFPLRSGVYRTQALMQGEYGRLKQRCLDKLVRAAGGDDADAEQATEQFAATV